MRVFVTTTNVVLSLRNLIYTTKWLIMILTDNLSPTQPTNPPSLNMHELFGLLVFA